MNKQGIFCTALAVAFALAVISFHAEANSKAGQHSQVLALAMQAEKASFIRSSLEKNFDRVVRNALQECADEGITESSLAEEKVNSAVLAALKGLEAAFGETVEFERLDRAFLNENSKVFVQEIKGVAVIEYVFTGGLLKSNKLRAGIRVGNAATEFLVRAGYTCVVAG